MENKLKEGPLGLLWKKRVKEDINDVAISNCGDCIIASVTGHIYSFNKKGDTLWKYYVKESDEDSNISISSDEGCNYILASVYLKYLNKHVYYIFNKLGQLLSKYEDEDIWNFDVSLSNGDAVVSTKNEKIYLFDKNKNKLWEYATDSRTIVRISRSGRHIVAGSEKGTIYFFNKNGKLLWNHTLKSKVSQIFLSSDGEYCAICSGEKKDNLYLFDNKDKLLWDYKNELINIKIEGLSPSGQCVITGSKLTTPKHDKMVRVDDKEYVVHVRESYTTYVCCFDSNGIQWKLEGDEWRLELSNIVISPDFEYMALIASRMWQPTTQYDPKIGTYRIDEVWFVDMSGKILWKHRIEEDEGFVGNVTKNGDYVVVVNVSGWWYLYNKNGELLAKKIFEFDENTIEYPRTDEYGVVRISANGKYLVTQYGNGVQLFGIKSIQ